MLSASLNKTFSFLLHYLWTSIVCLQGSVTGCLWSGWTPMARRCTCGSPRWSGPTPGWAQPSGSDTPWAGARSRSDRTSSGHSSTPTGCITCLYAWWWLTSIFQSITWLWLSCESCIKHMVCKIEMSNWPSFYWGSVIFSICIIGMIYLCVW